MFRTTGCRSCEPVLPQLLQALLQANLRFPTGVPRNLETNFVIFAMAMLVGAEEALKWSSPYWEPYVAGGLAAAGGYIYNKFRGRSRRGFRPIGKRGASKLPPRQPPRKRSKPGPPVIVGPGSGARNPTGTPIYVPPYIPLPTRIKKKKRKGKYFTTTGQYAGSFRRPRRLKPGMFAKRGCSLRVEAAGNVSQDKCIYIGHGTGATERIAIVMFQAIVRKLAVKCGYKPTSMDDKVNGGYTNANGQVGYRYTTGSTSATGQNSGTRFVTMGAGDSWADVASSLRTDFNTFGVGDKNLDIHEFIIRRYNDSVSAIVVDEKIIDVRMMKVKISVNSSLKIQNRTRAHSEVGAETGAAAQSALNVENNPLEGKVFYKKGNLFKLKNSYQTGSTFNLCTDRNSAVIGLGDIDTTGLSAEQISILQRPPSKYSFVGVNSEGYVKLNPGEIKQSFVKYDKTLSLNSLLRAMLILLDGGSEYFWPSVSKMFAFEKMMHTDDAEEPDMDIGYECNSIYKAAVFERGSLFGIQNIVA